MRTTAGVDASPYIFHSLLYIEDMKRFLSLLLIVSLGWTYAPAQKLSEPMQRAYNACMQLSKAIGAGNTTGLKAANKALKDCHTGDFKIFRCKDKAPTSIDGHFLFDEDFVDSLIAGRDVYRFARRYAEKRTTRSTAGKKGIVTKTCCVKAGQSTKYQFVANGLQELAFVAEPGGLLTVRIHDLTNNKWYNDTKDVRTGQPHRAHAFNLPTQKNCKIEVEIINTTKKEFSFVVLSN